METTAAPAGWYPDPERSGGVRYFDGASWTTHRAGPAGPPWKGAALGRPPFGSGALADPFRRLGARALDALVMVPVAVVVIGIAVALAAPHVGPMFPTADSNAMPGAIWIEVTVVAGAAVTGVLAWVYESVATARYGRTLGKAWLHIRPVRTDGSPVSWGRAFGRAGVHTLMGIISYAGLLDDAWCLWDDTRQCLHDKAVDTIVIND